MTKNEIKVWREKIVLMISSSNLRRGSRNILLTAIQAKMGLLLSVIKGTF